MSNSPLDGTLHVLGSFPSNSDVSLAVTDYDVGLESSSLTSSRLLLYWLN